MSLESRMAELIEVLRHYLEPIRATLQAQTIEITRLNTILETSDLGEVLAQLAVADLAKQWPKKTSNGHADSVEAEIAAATAALPTVAEPVAAKGPSFDEVTAIAQEVARLKTPPIAIKLINQHGADRLANLAPEKYPAFYAACEVLLGKQDAL